MRIPSSEFGAGQQLENLVSVTGQGGDIASDDNADENGDDDASDGVTSTVIALAAGLEPTTEAGFDNANAINAADDDNVNLTIDFGFENAAAAAIGNYVWHDADNDGVFDGGESGIDGVTVVLDFDANGDGDFLDAGESAIASTVTGDDPSTGGTTEVGWYGFEGLASGSYRVRIPTPDATLSLSSTETDSNDNQQDDDDNGIQSGGAGGETVSPTIAIAAGETDTTIDFGFVDPATLVGVGNLVWRDTDNDGTFDAGEGVDNVSVELYLSSQTPRCRHPGAHHHDRWWGGLPLRKPRSRKLHRAHSRRRVPGRRRSRRRTVPARRRRRRRSRRRRRRERHRRSRPPPPTASAAARSHSPSTANQSTPEWKAARELLPTTATTTTPTSASTSASTTQPPPSVLGNMVFIDTNADGNADAGEGIDGVSVELYLSSQTPGTDTPVRTTITAGGGLYQFVNLPADSYVVHIPSSEFGAGQELNGLVSLPGVGGDAAADDDADENGIDDVNAATNGISTGTIVLAVGSEPPRCSGKRARRRQRQPPTPTATGPSTSASSIPPASSASAT